MKKTYIYPKSVKRRCRKRKPMITNVTIYRDVVNYPGNVSNSGRFWQDDSSTCE